MNHHQDNRPETKVKGYRFAINTVLRTEEQSLLAPTNKFVNQIVNNVMLLIHHTNG